jgi:hypothetical protein
MLSRKERGECDPFIFGEIDCGYPGEHGGRQQQDEAMPPLTLGLPAESLSVAAIQVTVAIREVDSVCCGAGVPGLHERAVEAERLLESVFRILVRETRIDPDEFGLRPYTSPIFNEATEALE